MLILLTVGVVSAQRVSPDSVGTDVVKNKFLPTGFRIGTDVISLIKTRTQTNFSGWEINGDMDFYRYYLALDYGNWSRTFSPDSGAYTNNGRYWRVGADVNFLTKDPDRNMFFLGLRHGRSTFSEHYAFDTFDPVWGKLTRDYTNAGVRAQWMELVGGLKVKMWKFIWMGYTARFKFGLKTDQTSDMLPHDVPGYGRTDKETFWGFNYQILFRIPFRDAPVIPPAKKKK
ncbi:MAG: DUF6048 family protein [Bacteroidota bacterium]